MLRTSWLVLTALALFAGACASEPNSGSPDEGASCEVEGYPCSPGEQTDAAIALSEQYKADIQNRRARGDSYLDIATWLREQEGVVDVLAEDDRLRFRVEGGSAHWAYAPSASHPQASLPLFAGAGSAVTPKAILREGSSETKIKKKGLILEPFHYQFLSNTDAWKARIELLHDYEEVGYFRNRDIPDAYFGNWNDYRFVWVLSHGAYLPESNPQYTAIFSSKECGMYLWFATDVGINEVGSDGSTRIATLLGLPRAQVESQLTQAQLTRWRNFRDQEVQELKSNGQGCGVLEMPDAVLPVNDDAGNPIVRAPAFLDYIYYDDAWFDTKYAGGLDNVLLYLSVCASNSVKIPAGSSAPSSVFGWSKPMEALRDNAATDLLFERLFEFGDTVEDAFDKVTDAGHTTHTFDGATTELSHESPNDGDIARAREIVTILDPLSLGPMPDEGGMLEAREITGDGHTLLDVTVEIVGFGPRDADEFKVQIFDGNGQTISGAERDVDDPIAGDTLMTIPVSLNQEIRSPTEVEIEARVKLPEELGMKDSRHPIKVTVGPAIESLWNLNVGGAGSARGDFVFAPFPVGLVDEEGRVVWQITLAQLDNFVAPMATLFIVGHNGRTPDCTGQLGNFDALVSVQFDTNPMPTVGYGGGLGEGECGDSVNVEIVSFNKQDDLVANVSGTICEARQVGDEVVVTPVSINGRFQMPAAGCGADPGGDLIGSYYVNQEPSLCIDIYPNAAIAMAFEESCMAGGGLVCSDEPCPTAGQTGQCDYRDDSVQLTFRGQIQHFQSGGDWPPVGDLQLGCELQLGVWTTGQPAAP